MKNPLADQNISDCWNHVGVFGTSTCPELVNVNHCRNCSVYMDAAQSLLQRSVTEEYREEWARIFKGEKKKAKAETLSVVIFRIGNQWLALRTGCFREITAASKVHRLPHSKDSPLIGLVNIRGELQICISLPRLLGLPNQPPDPAKSPRRMMTIENGTDRWVFRVDEVRSTVKIDPSQLEVVSEESGFKKGSFRTRDQEFFLLDEDLMFAALRRSVS